MHRGLNLIWTLVSATVMVIALLAVISAFTGGSPFGFLEGIAGMGDDIPLEPGTGTEIYWNNLSVYIAEDTSISADEEQIALLTFSQPLRDNILQGGFMPVEVTGGPSGVGIDDGFEGAEFGLESHQLAFTLSGDLESGDEVTIEIVESITSQDGADLTEGACTDAVQDATAGEDAEASACN